MIVQSEYKGIVDEIDSENNRISILLETEQGTVTRFLPMDQFEELELKIGDNVKLIIGIEKCEK